MTDAPQQKDMFTKRWRRVKHLDPRESQIQIQLISELKFKCRKGVVYFHVPNGEERRDSVAAKLKAMGVMRGVADLVFVWFDDKLRVLFLELKRRDAALSPEQWAFSLAIREAGALYDWANSVEQALDILRLHGLLKR